MTEDLLASALAAERASTAHDDADYPLFHIAPPVGRLNDPNGLIVDADTYHAFFQYTPEHPRRLVYWGHATSPDLVHWTHHEPAILPDSHQDANGAYSGTAIGVDGGVELWYTGNYKDPDTGEREATQCVVTTPDLEVFTKVIPPIIDAQPEGYTAHFRDPQVWADPDQPGTYRMLLGVQRSDLTGTTLLYRSTDLREWQCEGEITFPDAAGAFDSFGYMWECPNLVRLRDEATGEVKDVLIFCPQGIEPQAEGFENVFPCIYIVGNLVGTEMQGCDGAFAELDRGFEFYAPQVFARRDQPWGVVDAEPALLVGWAGNAGEDDQPSMQTGGWVHCLTSPRVLALVNGRLHQRLFLPGVSPPADDRIDAPALVEDAGAVDVEALKNSRSWVFSARASYEGDSALSIEMGQDCGVTITISPSSLVVDRSGTRYPHGDRRVVSLEPGEAETITIVHDRSLTEIFLGGGSRVFTFRSFLQGEGASLHLKVRGSVRLDSCEATRAD